MLRLALAFFVAALAAALVGFGAFPDYTWDGAKVVFIICLVLTALAIAGQWFMPHESHLQRTKILNLPRLTKW